MTDREIADYCGMFPTRINELKKTNPKFYQALKDGYEHKDSSIANFNNDLLLLCLSNRFSFNVYKLLTHSEISVDDILSESDTFARWYNKTKFYKEVL
jgi:N-acetyl-gamma-glutamylphosphate reductase